MGLRYFFLLVLLCVVVDAEAQTAFVSLTSQSCSTIKSPAAKVEHMASVEQQSVLYAIENFDDKTISSRVHKGCTVIDKNNWNCARAFATKGDVKFIEDMQGYRHCYFKKRIFGGWDLIDK